MTVDEYIDKIIKERAKEIIAEMLEPVRVLKDYADVEILTLDEAAKVLRLDKQIIREACRRDEIPHRRIGRTLLFPKKTFAEYLCGEWVKVEKEKEVVPRVNAERVERLRVKVNA